MKHSIGISILLVATVGVLVTLGTSGPTADADASSVEERLSALEKRMARVEAFLPSLDRWENSVRAMMAAPNARRRADDKMRLGMLAGALQIYKPLPMRGGALDVYRLWRDGQFTADDDIDVFRSARTGIAPTLKERTADDYDFFPYHRYRGAEPPAKDSKTPLLWDKRKVRGDPMLVAFANGSVKEVSPEELARLLTAADPSQD